MDLLYKRFCFNVDTSSSEAMRIPLGGPKLFIPARILDAVPGASGERVPPQLGTRRHHRLHLSCSLTRRRPMILDPRRTFAIRSRHGVGGRSLTAGFPRALRVPVESWRCTPLSTRVIRDAFADDYPQMR